MEEERLSESGARAGHRHHRPRHRPLLPGQGRPHRRHPRRRTAPSRPSARSGCARSCRARTGCCAACRADAKQFDADALCDEYLGYAEQMRPHIPDTTRLLHDGLAGRQAHPVRGGPGQLARRRSRHLSVRHQLEQLDGRRLERLRRAGAEPRPHHRRHQGLHARASAAARSRPSWTTAPTASANAFARPAANTAP